MSQKKEEIIKKFKKEVSLVEKNEEAKNPEVAKANLGPAAPPPNACPRKMEGEIQLRCISLKVSGPISIIAKKDASEGNEQSYESGVYHFHYKETLEFTFSDASMVELMEGEKNWGVLSKRQEKKRIKFFNRDLVSPEAYPELTL